jgi:predicted acetyltransferase
MAFDVRPCRDLDEFGRAIFPIDQYLGSGLTDERIERFSHLLEIERMHAAFEGDEIVGGAGAFGFDLSVPGGSVPCAGISVVGVLPTHRRQGVLRAMVDAQLLDAHERGEPIAALWASEETIYGRFGYGIASWCGGAEIPRHWNAFAKPLERRGRARFVSPEEAAELFPPVHEAVRRERPGMFLRTPEWWELRRLRMPEEEKATPKRFVALELDGSTQAYAIYKTSPNFDEGGVQTRLEVLEALGATPQATAEIWRFLLDVDLVATTSVELLPPDHELFLLLANPRRARFRMYDALWIRLVDVGEALSGRGYAADGTVVFEVRDAVCPWNEGRWKLESGAASRTDEAADIALDVDALGSTYLGAVSFAQLRAGGRVEELADGAVRRADALFAWRPLPWCPEIF